VMPPSEAQSAFDLLHPAIQHHIVNSLGWRSLRPLQAMTIEPILAGDHVVATAPTAGGKTEAAVFPLFSRMLNEQWHGLSVLYVCPLRALLNNLRARLAGYGDLVGRRVGQWHGDTGQPERRRLLAEPPDLLLTTPESLESMLVSTGVDHKHWFADVQAVVIDEVHAFAGDDRGWHLLAVLERIGRLAGRELQRVGLSATLGNPEESLTWLTSTSHRPAHVISPSPDNSRPVAVTLDYVASLQNAALVISRLNRGEKRWPARRHRAKRPRPRDVRRRIPSLRCGTAALVGGIRRTDRPTRTAAPSRRPTAHRPFTPRIRDRQSHVAGVAGQGIRAGSRDGRPHEPNSSPSPSANTRSSRSSPTDPSRRPNVVWRRKGSAKSEIA
jgi:hypothetical protein